MSRHLHNKHSAKIQETNQSSLSKKGVIAKPFTLIESRLKHSESSSKQVSKKTTSWIWSHFDRIIKDNKAKCKHCPKTFAISGTGTMSRHLHNKHSGKIQETNQTTLSKKGAKFTSLAVLDTGLKEQSSSQASKKTTSWIWSHFDRIKGNKAKCKYCPKTFAVSGTGTMSRHLHNKHSTEIPDTNQSTLSTAGAIVKPFMVRLYFVSTKFQEKCDKFLMFFIYS